MLGEKQIALKQETTEDTYLNAAQTKKISEDALNEKTKNFMSKLSEGSKKLLSKDSKFVLGGTKFDSALDTINYFPDDKSKNDRFKLYVSQKDKGFGGDIPYPLGFRESDIQKENLEFSKYYSMYEERKLRDEIFQTGQDKLLIQIDELSKKIELHKKKRIIEDWLPDKVVCIRFSVPQPKKKSTFIDDSTFDERVLPALEKDLKQHRFMGIKLDDSKPLSSKDNIDILQSEDKKDEVDIIIMPDENNINIKRADTDLFDSIFN